MYIYIYMKYHVSLNRIREYFQQEEAIKLRLGDEID